MKIVQYNVLDGCREKEGYSRLSNFLKNGDYDVAGFNELNDWTAEEFQVEMEKVGFKYTYLFEMDSSRFLIGIAAKFPISKISAIEKPPFHHGMLHVKIKDINFIITHLTPFESKFRELEAESLATYIETIKEPLVVMGDLNTLSPFDKAYYDIEKISASKFQNRQHIRNGAINFRPMQILLDAGLLDVNMSEKLDYSMPTKIKGELKDPSYVRIDYILVNPILQQRNPVAKIIHHQDVSTLSDHYPIECKWEELTEKL
ncbi:hypothetical protein CIL05_00790 [Virgibacillus profundi]|uniref:Endonuclease/exonuclease/phosphatase domain-containing protein n=1 Tax=Virgibacillus profundi TaxID=2024555 RepID=A0A2A2IIS7_9BACI|nr:endonuclease/exonuclease/phosphatase family protein [Virgibacillus profundi]PAV31226.1 hypothetical protein CIL05_00790 [Virgibacillus profundi]PXY55411.1 endonuclease/exonuclease/phosphatase family protein [Virgibacillus profundi]